VGAKESTGKQIRGLPCRSGDCAWITGKPEVNFSIAEHPGIGTIPLLPSLRASHDGLILQYREAFHFLREKPDKSATTFVFSQA